MAIHLSAPRATELKPRIVVFGVGGAGGNAVNNMIDAGLEGVEFVVANTDAQQLQFAKTDRRIQLGATVTQGLGAGAHPEVGMGAAEESYSEISEHLEGAHMVFITAGMGGGTGTGAAPIIAKAARERGILTVGVVTKPFQFEGRHRMRLSDAGVAELQRYVDTLIVIPNQNLFRVANERTTFAEAFGMADQVLHSGVRSITDLMVMPGLINLDFADVRSVMTEMGKAMMGTGEAGGEDRALNAAQNAIAEPAAGRGLAEGRQGRAGQRHRRARHDPARGRRGGQRHLLGGRSGRQHHLRRRLRSRAGGPHPRLGGRHRHGHRRPGAVGALTPPGACTPPRSSEPGSGGAGLHRRPARPRHPDPRGRSGGAHSGRRPEPAEPTLWPEPLRNEPARTEPARTATKAAAEQPSIRIIDPAVEEMEHEGLRRAPHTGGSAFGGGRAPEPRAAQPLGYAAQRPPEPARKGGWLSLFGGRPRQDYAAPAAQPAPPSSPPAPARAVGGGAQPALQQAPSLTTPPRTWTSRPSCAAWPTDSGRSKTATLLARLARPRALAARRGFSCL